MPVPRVFVPPSYPFAMIRRASSTVLPMVVRTVLPVVVRTVLPVVVARTMLATRMPLATVSVPVHLLLICPLLRELLLISSLLPRVVATILPAIIVGSTYFSLVVTPIVESMAIDAFFVTTAALVFFFDKTPFLVALILLVAWRKFIGIFVIHAKGFVSLVLAFGKSFLESFQ